MIKKHLDYQLAGCTLFILFLGFLVFGSVAAVFSQEKLGLTGFYLGKQLINGVIGLILLVFLFLIPLRAIRRYSLLALIGNIILMFLVFLPGIGITAGGASRWLDLGFISLQPAEFFKLTFIIYIASWLTRKSENHTKLTFKENFRKILLPFIVVMGVVVALLYFQKDMSTLFITLAGGLIMYFVAATPFWNTALFACTLLIGGYLFVKFEPYRLSRVAVFLNPNLDPLGDAYHIKQALIAIGSGALWGAGLGVSNVKINLPETMADSIFAVYAKEMGFLGSVFLILLFLFFFWRCMRISKGSPSLFGKFLPLGIGSWICLQAFFNIASISGMAPVMGIPLPFVSYGGSHLITELAAVGILLNISKDRAA